MTEIATQIRQRIAQCDREATQLRKALAALGEGPVVPAVPRKTKARNGQRRVEVAQYLQSHGPARARDIVAGTGLSMSTVCSCLTGHKKTTFRKAGNQTWDLRYRPTTKTVNGPAPVWPAEQMPVQVGA